MGLENRRPWGWILYLILVVPAIVSYFMFREWWYNNLQIVLDYFREMSIIFGFLSFFTAFFHLRSIKEKEAIPEEKSFYFLGPFVYFIARPSITSSIFYVAMFMLYVIFHEPFYTELPPQELIILVAFIGGLLYWSISELHKMLCEIKYLEESVTIQRGTSDE